MKPHSIKFADPDWQTLESLAKQLGFKSVGNMVNFACQVFVTENSKTWQGGASWGSEPGSNRGRWKRKDKNASR